MRTLRLLLVLAAFLFVASPARADDGYRALRRQFLALADTAPRADVLALGHRLVDAWAAHKAAGGTGAAPFLLVAERFVQPGVAAYEEVPALIEAARQENAERLARRLALAGLDEKTRKTFERAAQVADWRCRVLAAQARGKTDDAEALREEMTTFLDKALAEEGVGKDSGKRGGWREKDEAFADFDLQDLDGKRWTLADFRDKKLIVNVWATWCGPCRRELPYVQQLQSKLRREANEDVVLVTFNMDFKPEHVAPFMKEKAYDFPVLLAADALAERDIEGIPLNWLVDSRGRLRRELVGFHPEMTAEEWIEDVLKEVAGLE